MLFLHRGPDFLQPAAYFNGHTHPCIQLFHAILVSFLFRRSQTESCQSQVAVIEVCPFITREFAETAHDGVLSQCEEIGTQGCRVVKSVVTALSKELQGRAGPESVTSVGWLARATAHP